MQGEESSVLGTLQVLNKCELTAASQSECRAWCIKDAQGTLTVQSINLGLIKETYLSLPRGWEGQQLSNCKLEMRLQRTNGALPFEAWPEEESHEDNDPLCKESRI